MTREVSCLIEAALAPPARMQRHRNHRLGSVEQIGTSLTHAGRQGLRPCQIFGLAALKKRDRRFFACVFYRHKRAPVPC